MNALMKKANYILHELGLLETVSRFGKPHVIGSCMMNLMAARDIDINISNERMSIDRLHELTQIILKKYRPTWYEAKEEITDEGKTVWFHGFHTEVDGEVWNVDLWFFDDETIEKAEAYCRGIMRAAESEPWKRNAILEIKRGLLERGLYSFDQFTSMDVYEAVLEKKLTTTEEFFRSYAKHPADRVDGI